MMHTEMEVYKTSMKLVQTIYELTHDFPSDEKWGLTSQMKRAVISIPSNIAEGCGRKSHKELINFMHIALGSLTELSTQLEIASMLGFVKSKDCHQKCCECAASVKRQLLGLLKKFNDQQSAE